MISFQTGEADILAGSMLGDVFEQQQAEQIEEEGRNVIIYFIVFFNPLQHDKTGEPAAARLRDAFNFSTSLFDQLRQQHCSSLTLG